MKPDRLAATEPRQTDSVPEGWRSVRLGDLFEQVVDAGHSEDLPVLSVTLDKGVVPRNSLDRRLEREVPRHQCLRARRGDIAYNTMRMWQGGSGLVREEGYLSPAYTVCRAKPGQSSEFWALAFKSAAMIRAFRAHSQGFAKDRYRLYFQHFATVPGLCPPLPEQRKIATILSSVDLTIEKTKAAITSLATLGSKLLHDLLTRGVPGQHARYNAIGKEWQLGRLQGVEEIPSCWKLVKLTTVARLESGHTPSRKAPEYWSGGIPWLSLHDTKNLEMPEIFETNQTISELGLDNSSARLLPKGTVVFSRTATVGKCTVLGREMATSQDFANYVCGESIYNRYLMHFLRHNRSEWNRLMAGSTHKTIYMPIFQNLQVPLPPYQEQVAIADIADKLDQRLTAEKAVVKQLLELKTDLTTSLLTGKIRVTPDEGLS